MSSFSKTGGRFSATIAPGLRNATWPNLAREGCAPKINGIRCRRHCASLDVCKEPAPRELGPITSNIWQTAQAGLNGDETTLRQGFDGNRANIDEIDRLGAAQVAKERAEKIAFDKLRETGRRDRSRRVRRSRCGGGSCDNRTPSQGSRRGARHNS